MQPTLEERILQLEVAEVNLKSNGRYLKWKKEVIILIYKKEL